MRKYLRTPHKRQNRQKGTKNIKAFDEVVGIRDCFSIPKTEFGPLMEAMGTVYCEEAHTMTINKPEVNG